MSESRQPTRPALGTGLTHSQQLVVRDPTEEAFMVRFREWASYCSRLRNLPQDPMDDARLWMQGSFWFGAATFVALLSVLLASSKRSAWLVPSLTVITLTALIVAEFCRRIRSRVQS